MRLLLSDKQPTPLKSRIENSVMVVESIISRFIHFCVGECASPDSDCDDSCNMCQSEFRHATKSFIGQQLFLFGKIAIGFVKTLKIYNFASADRHQQKPRSWAARVGRLFPACRRQFFLESAFIVRFVLVLQKLRNFQGLARMKQR